MTNAITCGKLFKTCCMHYIYYVYTYINIIYLEMSASQLFQVFRLLGICLHTSKQWKTTFSTNFTKKIMSNKRTKIIRIKTNRTWISFQCSFKWKAGGKRECKEPRVEAIYSTALLSCSTPTSSIVYMIYIAPRFERLLHCVKMNTNNNNCGGTGCKLLALKITGNQMIPYITTIKKNTHKCERQNRWKAKGNWFLKY